MMMGDCFFAYLSSAYIVDPRGRIGEDLYSRGDDLEEARRKGKDWLYQYNQRRRQEDAAEE